MNKLWLPLVILLFSCLYIFIIPDNPPSVKLICKLIPMVLIILYAYRNIPFLSEKTHYLILTGLIFSTIGDATLHWFVIGLGAFLIGHLFYIIAFLREKSVTIPRVASLLVLIPFGGWVAVNLIQNLQLSMETALIIPVCMYIAVILFMGFTAVLTGNIYAIIGSILFIFSDSVLAWDKFITPIAYSSVLIMGSYYGAQFLIAISIKTISQKLKAPSF